MGGFVELSLQSLSYTHIFQYSGTAEGIYLPVSVNAGAHAVVVEAALDTGSSFCLFTRSVAESLGIEVESGLPQAFGAASGRVLAYGHSVRVEVLGLQFDLTAFFFANPNIHKNLLGRRGWLDRVLLGLDEYRQVVYLADRSGSD